MGNNNATANLTEVEGSKLETNGMSPLESVPVETTQDQLFLDAEGKGKDTQETESQSKELSEDPKVEQEMHQNGLETDEQLQIHTSVAEGVETVCEVEELSMIGTQSVVSKYNTKESGNEEKPCVIDEIIFASPSFYETDGTEEKMVNNSLEEIAPAGEVVIKLNTKEAGNEEKLCVIDEILFASSILYETDRTEEKMASESLEEIAPAGEVVFDQDICMDQRTGFPEIVPQEILNLDYRVLDDEVKNEGKSDQDISKPGSQGSYPILETSFEVYKEERDMEVGREASLKRMSRCRSLPVSHNSRSMGDSLLQQSVSEVLLVSCLTINKLQETTEEITESSQEARLEMRSPSSFSNDIRIEERRDESTEETPLLSQGNTETFKATLDVEDKTVMLKRSETEKTRSFELSMNLSGRSDADDCFRETKGSGDNLVDKKDNRSDTLFVSCEAQETTQVITESNKETLIEMRSLSFGNDLRTKERSVESTEKILLLCQNKIEATIDVGKKNVMLKRSESEKTRGFELSLGEPGERSEVDDSLIETKDSGDNLLHEKASNWSPIKVRVRKRSKSSLFGTCLCCATAIN